MEISYFVWRPLDNLDFVALAGIVLIISSLSIGLLMRSLLRAFWISLLSTGLYYFLYYPLVFLYEVMLLLIFSFSGNNDIINGNSAACYLSYIYLRWILF